MVMQIKLVVVVEDCMNGDKRKWLTVKSMHRCWVNMVSQGTIAQANGKF